MGTWRLKISLFLNYFVFAVLLNSVGTVILEVQRNYGVSESAASILEPCKDLSIAAFSFIVASCLTRLGYRRAMLLGLGCIAIVCLVMPGFPGFGMTKLLFIAIGANFAFIKISVYSAIGLVASNAKEHASLMSFLEAFFMLGIFAGYFIFGAFTNNAEASSTAWLNVYYVLAALAGAAFLLLLTAQLDESAVRTTESQRWIRDFGVMFSMVFTGLVGVFIASVFFYVLIEQSIMSWLPTYNSKVLHLPATLSIEMASILAASTALGRFVAGFLLRRVGWFPFLMMCLGGAAILVLVALPLAHTTGAVQVTGWMNAPVAAFVFPMIGLFIAPIYPVINSVALSALPAHKHGMMAGLSVIFSALGGTTGSLITGRVFQSYGGQAAFYFSLAPIGALFLCLATFNRLRCRAASQTVAYP
jgi:fucose permease